MKDGWDRVDAEEEAYFNDENEQLSPETKIEADISAPVKDIQSLVNYPDDDEDDLLDLKPKVNPRLKQKLVIALKDDTQNLNPLSKKSRVT